MTIATETIAERFSCVAHIDGRLFYGVNNTVFYSQVMEGENISFLTKCYQKNDPTAEQLSDLLATDGGSIPINNANKIIQLKRYKNGLLVFADNGVWLISGPDSGFNATNYFVRDITETGCISADSVVAVEGVVYYWSDEGIYVIQDNEFGIPQAQSITQDTIQSFYDDISKIQKEKVNGVYNRIKKQIEWFYASTDQTGDTDYKYAKDRGLLYDLRSQGFFPQSYASTMSEASGTFLIGGVQTTATTENEAVQYLCIVGGAPSVNQLYSADFATKADTSFQDFSTNFSTAYFESGFETLGKPSNSKNAPYVTMHFKQTEQNWVSDGSGGLELDLQSSCKFRPKWDFNNSSVNGRWGPAQEAYRFRRPFTPPSVAGAFDSGEDIINTRNKVLGRGKALSLRFEQTTGKDFQLLGYTIQWSMNARI